MDLSDGNQMVVRWWELIIIWSYNELMRWPTALLCFVEAHIDLLGPAMRLFCKSPDMSDSDYKDLHPPR